MLFFLSFLTWIETCDPYCVHWNSNYLAMDVAGIGPHLLSMAIQGVIFCALVLFSDTTLAHRLWLWIKSGKYKSVAMRTVL